MFTFIGVVTVLFFVSQAERGSACVYNVNPYLQSWPPCCSIPSYEKQCFCTIPPCCASYDGLQQVEPIIVPIVKPEPIYCSKECLKPVNGNCRRQCKKCSTICHHQKCNKKPEQKCCCQNVADNFVPSTCGCCNCAPSTSGCCNCAPSTSGCCNFAPSTSGCCNFATSGYTTAPIVPSCGCCNTAVQCAGYTSPCCSGYPPCIYECGLTPIINC